MTRREAEQAAEALKPKFLDYYQHIYRVWWAPWVWRVEFKNADSRIEIPRWCRVR